jgi:hypothetical protein
MRIAEIRGALSSPFRICLSRDKLDRVMEEAVGCGGYAPSEDLSECIGAIYGKGLSGALEVEVEGRELEVEIGERRVFGTEVGAPLMISSLAAAVKYSERVDEKATVKIVEMRGLGNLSECARVRYFRSVSPKTRFVKEVMGEAMGLVGHSSPDVQIEAIFACVRMEKRERTGVCSQVLGELEKEAEREMPNPRWTPGMLVLVGVLIYNRMEMDLRRVRRILERYVTKRREPAVLNSVLVVIWSMIRARVYNLDLLALLSVFGGDRRFRRTSCSLLVETLGRDRSPKGLFLMDALAEASVDEVCEGYRKKRTRVFRLLKSCGVKKNLAVEYAKTMVLERNRKRRSVGMDVLRKNRYLVKRWEFGSPHVTERTSALEMVRRMGNEEEKKAGVLSVDLGDKIFGKDGGAGLVEAYLDLARSLGSMKDSDGQDGFEEKVSSLIIYALRRDLALEAALKCFFVYKEQASPALAGAFCGSKSRGVVIAYGAVCLPGSRVLCDLKALAETGMYVEESIASLYLLYLLGRDKDVGSVLTNILVHELECYKLDEHLGDVGSFRREDALNMLLGVKVERRKEARAADMVLRSVRRTETASFLKEVSELKRGLGPLVLRKLLKYTMDRSRRVSFHVLDCLVKRVKRMEMRGRAMGHLKWLHKRYTLHLEECSKEESVVRAWFEAFRRVASESIARDMVCGLVNSLLSADGHLYKRVVEKIQEEGPGGESARKRIEEALEERKREAASRRVRIKIEEIIGDIKRSPWRDVK